MSGVGFGPRAVKLPGCDPSRKVDAVEGVVGAAEYCFVAGYAGAEDVAVAEIDELTLLRTSGMAVVATRGRHIRYRRRGVQ